MPPRIDYHQAPPSAAQVMMDLQHDVDTCGLEPALLELVKLRASQSNGCACCIDRHTKAARAMGETEPRLSALNA
jgi:AhpD family alkylhydroperoxidase